VFNITNSLIKYCKVAPAQLAEFCKLEALQTTVKALYSDIQNTVSLCHNNV